MEAKGRGAIEDSWNSAQVDGATRKDGVSCTRRTAIERNHAGKDIAGRTVAAERYEHTVGRGGSTPRRAESTIERTRSTVGRTSSTIRRDSRASSTSAAAGSGNRTSSSSSAAVGRTGRADSIVTGRIGRVGSAATMRGASSSSARVGSTTGKTAIRDGRGRFIPSKRAILVYMPNSRNDQRMKQDNG
ncbi:hypothetical protein COCNU_09G001960 [Cocos nucifera]|uniref:Uncharacterized protein n=1 Tax=Cocos nucifera TaxID=13894 RepID=A0A8K0IIV7_COCNU|nr:hypothetical protein COCNU_09G001960 [Cocos nucifera]